jgi:hypothetical protein
MLVEKGNTLKGSLTIEGDLTVEGTLSGDVEISGALIVESGGEARGALRCERAELRGVLGGTLTCRSEAAVWPTARVAGRVVAAAVVFGETLGARPEKGQRPEREPRPEPRPEPRAVQAGPARIPLVTGTSGKLLVRPTAVLKEGKS